MPSIFLSHTSSDKPFVRKLAIDLELQGVRSWIDEAEIRVGDSLIEKIRGGIDEMTHVAVILSPSAIASPWVQREVDVAMNQEIAGRIIKVLPVLYQQCNLPGFLLGKLYADFTDSSKYCEALERFVRSIGVVFNRRALDLGNPTSNLRRAVDRAAFRALPLLSKPFYRPFQYIGLRADEVAEATGAIRNSGGNLVVESDECRMVIEVEGAFVSYVEADLMKTAPHKITQEIDADAVLGAFSVNSGELELVRMKTNFYTFYDHRRRLKVSVCCYEDGMPISVSFSAKYYGM
jgi:hypothetical protein